MEVPPLQANVWSLAGKTIQAFAVKSGILDSSVLSGVFSYPPLKTGQTTVYQTGDNGTHQSGVARGYTDNGDGTVKDNAMGLVWQQCSRGQNNDATCTGLSLASRTWRLPTRQELESLPDYSKATSPAIDTTYFPGTVADLYWSSTTYAPNTDNAWYVNFGSGDSKVNGKTFSVEYIRCVSGP